MDRGFDHGTWSSSWHDSFLVSTVARCNFGIGGWARTGIARGVTKIAIALIMSRTRKDAAQQSAQRIVLEVAANGDGTFVVTFNAEVVGSHIPERWLDDELCAKRGFCGEELAAIKRQLVERGRAVVTL